MLIFECFFFSYIVLGIYCSGFIYSLPRFFEYKTELRREQLTVMENFTEYVEHTVIKNKVLHNRLYHYIVHLSKTIIHIHV
jgi:hypothetical protein